MWSGLLWWRPPCQLREVIVNLANDKGSALQGVLWSARGPWLTLRNVSVLSQGQPPTPLDGESTIHRANITFIQVLP
jgi:hypothetical protein